MSWFFTPHAKARAKERYGLDLTIRELSFIATSCNRGGAALVRSYPNGTNVYGVELRGVWTFPVMSPDKVIITFQPEEFLVATAAKKRSRARNGMRDRPPRTGRNHEPYVRDRTPRYAQGAGE